MQEISPENFLSRKVSERFPPKVSFAAFLSTDQSKNLKISGEIGTILEQILYFLTKLSNSVIPGNF